MPLPGSDVCVPALLGMEYPDPMGSGLSVPVLGGQADFVSGKIIPLAGTMEDPDGKGTVRQKKLHWFTVHLIHFFHFCVALHRPGGYLLRFSDCGPGDWGVDPSGWSQVGCVQETRCASHSLLLADGGQ